MISKWESITKHIRWYQYVEKWSRNLFLIPFPITLTVTISAHQSGFHNNESCVNPLLAIIHEIYIVFDNNLTLEMRRVFTTSQRLLTKYDMLD